MLNLSRNKLMKLHGAVKHLDQLVYLDISFNAIEELEPEAEMPKGLHVLRWNSNPFLRKPVPGDLSGKELYRRRAILHCLELAELDK